jgi:hypothetical protein
MLRKVATVAIIAVLLVGGFVYFRWSSSIRQPLQFSHSAHVKRKIDCATCHGSSQLDSLPQPSLCVTCHKDKKFPDRVQWVRVYRVAPDIIFSHEGHLKDDCSVCHKQMSEASPWIHEARFKMDFCMKCHEQRGADNTCRACHKNR